MVAAGLCAVSCYDDSDLWDEIDTLKSRMTSIERAYDELTSYKTILQNMEAVESIVQNADGSYTINFFNADPITIANGATGETGAAGQDGQDGVTPSFKIEDGQWYVSYDNGESWQTLGEAAGNSLFQDAYMDGEDTFVIVLLDGTEVRIPLRGGGGPGGGGGEGPGGGGEQGGNNYEAWLGTWSYANNTVTLAEKVNGQSYTMTDSDGLDVEIAYNSDGTISLQYPTSGYVGTMSNGNKIYIRGYASNWVTSSVGDVLVTWTLSEDKNTGTAQAADGISRVYAYCYDSSNTYAGYVSSFGSGNLAGNLTKVSGGGGGGGGEQSGYKAWLGTWALAGKTVTISEKVSGESLQVVTGGVKLVLTYNSDGTVSFNYPTYGWVGRDSDSNDYYFNATTTSGGWASQEEGDLVATWTLSGSTATIAVATGLSKGYIYAYDAEENYLGYVSDFGQSNMLVSMTKQ